MESLIHMAIEPLSRDGLVWTLEETRMAFALYLTLPPRDITKTNPDICQLAEALGRKPGAVAKKIGNIQSCDKNRVESGKVGLTHINKYDREVWALYSEDEDGFLSDAIDDLRAILHEKKKSPRLEYMIIDLPEGESRQALTRKRVNQEYFRNSLINSYGHRCCLTGMADERLLIASHIRPWSTLEDQKSDRVNPANGLLLNALHDKAFDKGLITIDRDYKVVVSSKLRRDNEAAEWLYSFKGREIALPSYAPPAREFIEYHNDMIFVA